MTTIIVNQFDGGITNDPRDPRGNVCRQASHFDLFTDKHRMFPHYSAESGNSAQSTQQIVNYAYEGTTLYGLGADNGAPNLPKIYTRTNFTDAVWTADAGGYTIAGAARTDADTPFFVYYRKTAKLYGVRAGTHVYSVVPATSANTTEANLTSYTTVSNGVVHSKDDILYLGYDNKIAKNDNGSWTVVALTLPSQYVITSICEFGDFLAIGCRHKGSGNSRVFLWNRNETTTILSQSIDWEQGNLMCLEELEGYLVGVSFEGDTGSANVGQTRVIFRDYDGSSGAAKFAEFTGFSQSPGIQSTLFKAKTRHRILFPAIIPIGGIVGAQSTGNVGIWAITKSPEGFSVSLEYLYANATTSNTLYGLIQIGDFIFSSYTASAVLYMDKTDDTVVYTTASVYESTVNPGMEPGEKIKSKQLEALAVFTEKLQSGQQIVAKYKVDGATSWTTVFTKTSSSPDTDLIGYESPIPASGQFTSGREYEFRIDSTGGAIVTGFGYKYHTIKSLL